MIELVQGVHVSRETLQILRDFEGLLHKWTSKINLISRSTKDQIWERHILDSVQLQKFLHVGITQHVDIGSGGGLPGIVLAILNRDNPNWNSYLIESDKRKASFLRVVAHELDLAAEIYAERIETLEFENVDLITARALADLNDLCGYTQKFFSSSTLALFQKGADWKKEVERAEKSWNFDLQCGTSLLHSKGVILQIRGLCRAKS